MGQCLNNKKKTSETGKSHHFSLQQVGGLINSNDLFFV